MTSTPLRERKLPYPGHISDAFPPYQSSCSGIKSSGALFYKFSIRTLSLFSSMFAKMFVFRQNRSLFVYFLFHFISFLGKYHWSRFSWAECRYNFCANISAPLVFSFLYSFLFKETHPNLYCITVQTYLTVKSYQNHDLRSTSVRYAFKVRFTKSTSIFTQSLSLFYFS